MLSLTFFEKTYMAVYWIFIATRDINRGVELYFYKNNTNLFGIFLLSFLLYFLKSSFQNSSQLAVIFEIPSPTIHDFSPFCNKSQLLHSPSRHILSGVFSVSLSACLATLPTSRPPALQRVSTWLLPDKIYQSRLPGFLIHLNNITKSAIHTLFLIHSPLLASHAQGWSRAWATNHSVSGSLS